MQITLVAIHPARSPQSLPLANAFLAATLLESSRLSGRVKVTLLDLFCEQGVEESIAAITATRADMVGFSVYLWNRGESIAIAGRLRLEAKQLILFCGGPEATADPVKLLAEAPFNFIVAGEGEGPLPDIVACILDNGDLSVVPGVARLDDAKYLFTPPLHPGDPDSIPSPFLSGILKPAEYQGFLWQLSRGCCFDCDFCFDAKDQRGVRRFGIERIAEELSWFVEQGVSQVFVLDSTFNQDKKRAAAILGLIAEKAPDIHFHFEVRSEFIDRKQAKLFAATRCSLQIGLQSCSPDVLKNVNRSFDRDDFIRRIGFLEEVGAIFGFDLIYGLPGDTLAGFRESLDFALSLYPNHLDIFPLAVLPGTKLAARSQSLGLDHLLSPPYSLLASPTFTASDMVIAARVANACDIFYSRGRAVAWFASITAGLGISASTLFEEFAAYLERDGNPLREEAELTDNEIWKMQRDFLKEAFIGREAADLLLIALDLVDYNHHYASALMAVPPNPPDDLELQQLLFADLPLSLAGSASLAIFNYEILEILEAGAPDLEEFVSYYSPDGSFAVIYPINGEIATESLIKPYYLLLELLDGKTPVGQLASRLDIPADEAASFLEFAVLQGVAILPWNSFPEAVQ